MNNKISLIFVSFLSLISSVSAATQVTFPNVGDAILRVLTAPVSLVMLDAVPFWMIFLIFALLFGPLFMSANKVFKENKWVAIIVALSISLIVVFGTPFAGWVLGLFSISWFLFWLLFVLATIAEIIFWFSKVHGRVAEGTTKIGETHSEWKKDKKFFNKEQRQAKKELSDLDEVIKEVKTADKNKDTADFNQMVRDAISHLEHVRDEVVRSINLENKRFKAEHDDAIEELKDLARKVRADIEDALDALHNKRPETAEKDLKRAKKKLKRWKKDSRKLLNEGKKAVALLEEGKGDTSEVINKAKKEYTDVLKNLKEGKYTQEQAVEWQEKIWGEFTRDMSKFGYDNNQIKDIWEKEIWSLGHVEEVAKENVAKQPLQLNASTLDSVIKPYKEQYSEVLKSAQEGKYTQEQAVGWQEKIWGQFTKELRKQGYNEDQIKELWEKEIWSLGHVEKTAEEGQQTEQNKKWKELMQKKIERINPLFQVDLVKHPKKAKNYIRDIRKDIDDSMMDAATSLGQDGNMNSYVTQFDQILDFFEHTKKPNEANEDDWKSVMNIATAYKNFLLSLRDNF